MYQRFVLTYNSNSETLTINPDGWAENGQSWQRDSIYHGVFQTYTVDTFRFSNKSGGGFDFILAAYEIDDLKTDITVDVYNRNPQTDDYDLSYSGKLNFDPDKFTIERDFIEIGFIQSGVLQKFMTRDEISLDITKRSSIDGITTHSLPSMPKTITIPNVYIYRQLNFDGNYNNNFYFSLTENPPLSPSGTWYQPTGDILLGGIPIYINLLGSTININETGDNFKADGSRPDYFYENDLDNSTQLIFNQFEKTSGNIICRVVRYQTSTYNETTYFELVIQEYNGEDTLLNTTIVDSQTVVSSNDPGVLNPYNVIVDLDFSNIEGTAKTIESGNKLRIGIRVYTNDPSEWQSSSSMEISGTINMSIDITERLDGIGSTTCKAWFPHEAFTRLLNLITSENFIFDSEILGRTDSLLYAFSSNGIASLDAIVSGWGIRQFPDKPITVTFRNLFKAFDSIYNLGFYYDLPTGRFKIVQKADLYDYETILFDLGEVASLTIKPYKNAYFNDISGGYDNDGKYESLEGIKCINTQIDYSTDQPIKETLDIRCPYHADTPGIKFAREKDYERYANEDTDYDDNIYIMRTDGSTAIQGGTNLSGFQGIDDYFNIALLPRENIIRWGNFIRSQYWRDDTGFVIKFSKSKKAVDITYQNQNGDIVNEFDDIQANEFPDVRLFDPQYYEFEGIFDLEKLVSLQNNPHGLIYFQFNGVQLAGFVDQISTKDYDKKAKYKLIAYDSPRDIQKIFMDGSDVVFMDGDKHKLL